MTSTSSEFMCVWRNVVLVAFIARLAGPIFDFESEVTLSDNSFVIKWSIPKWRRGFWLFCTPWMVLNRRGEQRISAHEPDDHEPSVVKHGC